MLVSKDVTLTKVSLKIDGDIIKRMWNVAESLPAGSGEDWLCWRSPAHRGGPCENSDEEMRLSRRRPVGGLRLRGATDDGPPPLLPPTRRGMYGWRPQWQSGQRHAPASWRTLCKGYDRRRIKQTDNYTYLGQTITSNGKCDDEILKIIDIARSAFNSMLKAITARHISMKTRKIIIKAYDCCRHFYTDVKRGQ